MQPVDLRHPFGEEREREGTNVLRSYLMDWLFRERKLPSSLGRLAGGQARSTVILVFLVYQGKQESSKLLAFAFCPGFGKLGVRSRRRVFRCTGGEVPFPGGVPTKFGCPCLRIF